MDVVCSSPPLSRRIAHLPLLNAAFPYIAPCLQMPLQDTAPVHLPITSHPTRQAKQNSRGRSAKLTKGIHVELAHKARKVFMLEETGENVLAELLVVGNCYSSARSVEVLHCFFLQGVGWVGGRRWRKRVARRTQERVAVERPVDELVGLGVRDHTANVSVAPISVVFVCRNQQNAFLYLILITVSGRNRAP